MTTDIQVPKRRSRWWLLPGELLIVVGSLLLLFVAYQMWWTNVMANWRADASREQLLEELPPFSTSWGNTVPEMGEAFAVMYIPALQAGKKGMPVIQGVREDDLRRGLGHYPETALPGQVGNFAVAGHRATNGEPLANIDRLSVGDEVFVRSQVGWSVYTLVRDQLVWPLDGWVVDARPFKGKKRLGQQLVTITTCHPRWGSSQRWVWWGELTAEYPPDQTPPGLEAT